MAPVETAPAESVEIGAGAALPPPAPLSAPLDAPLAPEAGAIGQRAHRRHQEPVVARDAGVGVRAAAPQHAPEVRPAHGLDDRVTIPAHLVPRLAQKPRRHAAVNSARHGQHDARHGRKDEG